MYTYFFIRLTLLAVRFLFFFYSYADPRDLHSFPTRRSSDLHAVAGRGGDNGWDPQHLGGLGQGDNVMFEFPGLVIPDAGHQADLMVDQNERGIVRGQGGVGLALIGHRSFLLHGYAETSDSWGPLATALAKSYTIVVPDPRGIGRSSRPAGGYDKKTQAADIRAVVTTLGWRTTTGPEPPERTKMLAPSGLATVRARM